METDKIIDDTNTSVQVSPPCSRAAPFLGGDFFARANSPTTAMLYLLARSNGRVSSPHVFSRDDDSDSDGVKMKNCENA